MKRSCELGGGELVAVGDRDEDCAVGGQLGAGGGLGLAECRRVVGGDSHHLSGGLHLRAEQGVGAGEAVERQYRLLHGHVAGTRVARRRQLQVEVAQLLAEHQPTGHLGERHAHRLRHERHRPRRPRVGLDHVQLLVAVDGVLDIDQAHDAERERQLLRGLLDLSEHLGAEG